MHYYITTPLTEDKVHMLKAGDTVSISGKVYTARDAAHKRMIDLINKNNELPIDIKDQIIYYVGPCPAKPGKIIGSCGPTTSGRMDMYAPELIKRGLTGMIGKGLRNKNVIDAMVKHKAVYFGVIGGLGALLTNYIIDQKLVAFPELGTEAIRELTVKDLPAVVLIDSNGDNLYELGKKRYAI